MAQSHDENISGEKTFNEETAKLKKEERVVEEEEISSMLEVNLRCGDINVKDSPASLEQNLFEETRCCGLERVLVRSDAIFTSHIETSSDIQAVISKVKPINVNQLASCLNLHPSNCLLIDCRSFMDYNASHISTAHNVHYPPIVKRRSGGSLTLSNIIRCPETLQRLQNSQYSIVVAYDASTKDLADLALDSNLMIVLKTMCQSSQLEFHYLQGGFRSFRDIFHRLCTAPTPFLSSSDALQPPIHNPLLRSRSCPEAKSNEGDPIEILPWLYIGNEQQAARSQRLQELGFTSILSVVPSLRLAPPPPIRHRLIPVVDVCTADISRWFSEAIRFIEEGEKQQGKVLVHCQAGVSRSATIVIAYLMYRQELSLEQAYEFLQQRHSGISPNLSFMCQLVQFEAKLNARLNDPNAPSVLSPSGSPVQSPTSCTPSSPLSKSSPASPLASPS